jgi:hypothetical protein
LTQVIAVEPVADIAVLGALDGQEAYDECEAYEQWCDETEPVPVSDEELAAPRFADRDRRKMLWASRRVHVLTHEGKWVSGNVTRYGAPNGPAGPTLHIKTDAPIKGGTSGGLVVDSAGRLVDVVSWTGGESRDKGFEGMVPSPYLALPLWIWRRLQP